MSVLPIKYEEMQPEHFCNIIELATAVHGVGYLDQSNINDWYQKGIKDGVNANFVAISNNKVIGFRLTYAVNNWDIDKWCTPSDWNVNAALVCYFKCNTVDQSYRGQGVGGKLLKLSITAAKKQGAQAGVSHLWKQSPGNSAVKYFTKCGGVLIKEHPDRWLPLSKQGYECPVCTKLCHCDAAEMIIYFNK